MTTTIQDYVAYGLILSFGVLHGANDITLISSLSIGKKPVRKLLLTYLGAMALVTVFFLISKGLALLFFILISAYHFGEQHLGKYLVENTKMRPFLFTAYGLLILLIIFNIKVENVIPVIADVSGISLSANLFQITLISTSLILLVISIYLLQRKFLQINPIKEFFYLGVLGLVFANSSLVWGFATYFILWHSLPSMNDQLGHLYGDVNKKSFLKYLKSSALYWFASIAGLGILYWLLRDSVDYFITVVLYVLAAITFPHVIVMSKVEALRSSRES